MLEKHACHGGAPGMALVASVTDLLARTASRLMNEGHPMVRALSSAVMAPSENFDQNLSKSLKISQNHIIRW